MKRQSFDILKSQRKATDNGPKKGNLPMDIRQERIGPLAWLLNHVEGWSLSKKFDICFAGSLNLVVVLNKIDGLNNFGGLAKQRQGIKMKRISMTYEPVSKALSLVKVVVRILPRCPCSPKIGE